MKHKGDFRCAGNVLDLDLSAGYMGVFRLRFTYHMYFNKMIFRTELSKNRQIYKLMNLLIFY